MIHAYGACSSIVHSDTENAEFGVDCSERVALGLVAWRVWAVADLWGA